MPSDNPIELPEHTPISLPDVFPMEEVVVDDEEHIYQVYQGNQGPLPEDEYTLNKAPIIEIRTVTGTVDEESEYEFEQGVDYTLSADSERIVWLNGDRPDPGTVFYVTYLSDSIIGRYGDTADEELDVIKHTLEEAIKSKFISTADGNELDRIGSLFGPVIGKRRGRDDEQYRIYLESVVQSFISRGTVTGIKLAISAATDVPVEDITIDEDFEQNEYEVVVIPNTPVDVALLETISDIADPSGIRQVLTRFPVFEQTGVTDAISSSQSIRPAPDEEVTIGDSNASFRRQYFEGIAFDDLATVPDKAAVTSDEMLSADAVTLPPAITETDSFFVDDSVTLPPAIAETDTTGILEESVPRRTPIDEEVTISDEGVSQRTAVDEETDVSDVEEVLPREINTARWEEQTVDHTTEWNFFEWTEIVEIATDIVSDEGAVTDAVQLPPAITNADQLAADDAVNLPAAIETTDTGFSDDTVTLPPAIITTDTAGVADEVFLPKTIIDETVDVTDTVTLPSTPVDEVIDVTDTVTLPSTPTTDITGIDDGDTEVLPRDTNTARWEEQDVDHTTEWNFFEWTELIDLFRDAGIDEVGMTDATATPPKAAITADSSASDDAVTNIGQTSVAWEISDWESMNWAVEHN